MDSSSAEPRQETFASLFTRLPWPTRGFWRDLSTKYRRMLRFVRPYWARLAAAAVFMTLDSLLGLALPYGIQYIVDGALVQANMQTLNEITAALFLLFVARAALGFGETYILAWVAERVVANLREQLYAHLHTLPLRFFNATRVGELISRLTNDVMTIQDAVTTTLLSLLSQLVTLIGGTIILFYMDWRLALLMFSTVPLVIVGMFFLGRAIGQISKQVQDALADVSATSEEALAGVRIVKSFAREPYEVTRYTNGVERLFDIALRRVRVRAILGPIIGLMAFTAIAIVLWFGGREVIQGHMTPGQLVSFLIYTIILAYPISTLTGLYGNLRQAMGASERVFDLLDRQPELQDDPDAVDLPPIDGNVVLQGVSFDYGDSEQARVVLRDVSLDVKPGQVVALVGPSGAGKSTLVNLIPRFYDPTAGSICIDGYDIRHVRMRSLREQIGIVPQETALFSGSVRENILYGNLLATEEMIQAAARAANAHDFILALAEGYNTQVGERGVKLSGGQRQRIAIARAILKDPRILILDEATSSLDSESELAVQGALENLMLHRTSFVIAHRLSTITNADWIVVLDNGRILEQGTHAELLALPDGLYRRLHAMQFRWDLEDDTSSSDEMSIGFGP
jgi:ATP-binding cassette, subfamily B, bacterial MsbA